MIDQVLNHLEAHNTLLSDLVESRQVMTQLEASLSDFSERMLSGVAIKYGKKSVEYARAGGSYRKRGSQPVSPTVAPLAAASQSLVMTGSVSQTRNGQVAQPDLN